MPLPSFPVEGGCRCGALRFRLTAAPLVECVCHCRGCQRMSSSAYSLTAICAAPTFEILEGEPVIGGNRAPELPHYFCARCMTWAFTRPAALPDVVNVRPTLLDDPTWFAPYLETCTASRLPWVNTGAPASFEAFPQPASFPTLLADYAVWRAAR